MSVHFNWRELVSNQPWQASVRAQIRQLLDEKVNQKAAGEPDDGTRVHLLELEMGEEPPQVELLQLGMQEEGDDASGSFAVESQQHLRPHEAVPSLSPSAPVTPSALASATPARPAGLLRCPACHLVLPAEALTLPGVSLKGRVAYSGSAWVTLQIRRQVNPFASSLGGVMGRLSRIHLTPLAMEKPATLELWVRLSDVTIDGEVDVTYTPAVKTAVPGSATAVAAAAKRIADSNSDLTSPSRSNANTPRPWHSSASSPSPALSSSFSSSSDVDHSISSSPSPSPYASPIQRIGSAGPGLHRSTPGASESFASPIAAVPSVHPHRSGRTSAAHRHLCECAMSASFLGASSSEVITSPAVASILLSHNPLTHVSITSCLDGSPAGDKLRGTIEQEMADALGKIVGQRLEIKLPSGGGGKKA